MNETIVYHEQENKWYRRGDDPWRVRVADSNHPLAPVLSVEAHTYLEAFAKLFGHTLVIPPPTYTCKHILEAA
jgi:hypothetical protein